MATKRDYYEILGVGKTASPEEIKKAYRKAAAANHPDRNPGDEAAVERFKEAAEAFDVLGDAEKRELYDRYGHEAVSRSGRQAGFNDVEDVFSAFGGIFEGLFGGAQQGRGGRRAARGDNLRCTIKIDLKEAAFGCGRTIEVRRNELCGKCDGSGAKPGSKPEKCPYCSGRGQIVQSQGFFRVQTTCPACRGEGEIIREKCPQCSGSGREVKPVRLEVKVPAGVDNGMQLCLRGEGDPGLKGGPRGDLFCDIQVAEHPLFKRHEQDLVCAVPISYAQAALGATLEIPTLAGREELAIDPGAQPGDVIRLRGKGMPDPQSPNRRKGDLLVQLMLEVPRNLTPRQEELLRELAELEKKNVSPHQKSFFEKIKD
ncbi:MAG: molecular chaperone DnaJ, partial [Planctomycetes bacterium]|nr:molecular chaperone DnaJ [Planctomycetota bacterium]